MMNQIPGWEPGNAFGYPEDKSDVEIAMDEVNDYAEMIKQKAIWEAMKRNGQYKPPITPWNPPELGE